MRKCTILVGVPASGKSTWLKNNYENMEFGSIVASTDNIIEELADMFGFTYNDVFSETIRFADMVMNNNLIVAAEDGVDIYVDRTNLSQKSRRHFIKTLKPYGYTFDDVVFETPEKDEWKRRLNSRCGKSIPNDVIDRMVNSYEIPLENEGFEKITFIENNV